MEAALYEHTRGEIDRFCKEVWNNKVFISAKTKASLEERGGGVRSALDAVVMLKYRVEEIKRG